MAPKIRVLTPTREKLNLVDTKAQEVLRAGAKVVAMSAATPRRQANEYPATGVVVNFS